MACNEIAPFQHGEKCAKLGYSIHYNPYHHCGTAEQFLAWENGWMSVLGGKSCHN